MPWPAGGAFLPGHTPLTKVNIVEGVVVSGMGASVGASEADMEAVKESGT